jgi:hypothetical protein
MTNKEYCKTRDSVTLLFFAAIALILAMALNSCTTQKSGCRMTSGYVGYGNR